MSQVQPPLTDRVFSGILLTSVAYALFSGQDAAIKLLVASVSVWQILFFRSLFVVAGCLVVGGPALLASSARSPILGAMMLRSFVILCAWLCYYTAAASLQLAELTTIYFAAPVIVTVLSVVILRESVPGSRWLAVVIGFAGVFVACDPARLGLSIPVMLALAAAALWAVAIVLIRKIALRERTIVQVVLNNIFFLAIAAGPMVAYWVSPSPAQWALMVGVGALGGLAQFTLFEGMKLAPASVIAPFEYTSLVWAFALGYLIWSDVPRTEVFIGAALIVLAGLTIIIGENRRLRTPAKP